MQEQFNIKVALVTVLFKYTWSMKPKIITYCGNPHELAIQACLAFSPSSLLQYYKNTASCSLLTIPGQIRALSLLSYIKYPLPLVKYLISLSSVLSVLFNGTPSFPAFLYLCFSCPLFPSIAIICRFPILFAVLCSLECSQYTQALGVHQ